MNIVIVDENRSVGVLTGKVLERSDFVIMMKGDHFKYLKNRYVDGLTGTYHKHDLADHISTIQWHEERMSDINKLFENTVESEKDE